MGSIIALTNPKGGVGKSTVAVHLAAWCYREGRRTVLVDADAQGASSLWLQEEAEPAIPISRLQPPDEILDQVPRLSSKFDVLERGTRRRRSQEPGRPCRVPPH
jgi:chromosome partitioning protein